jgi:hypothetical protein
MKIRMFPPYHLPQVQLVGGVDSYSGTPSQHVDVPAEHAPLLSGWICVAPVGSTSERPLPPLAAFGSWFIDTDLGKAIVFEGYNWRDPITSELAGAGATPDAAS